MKTLTPLEQALKNAEAVAMETAQKYAKQVLNQAVITFSIQHPEHAHLLRAIADEIKHQHGLDLLSGDILDVAAMGVN